MIIEPVIRPPAEAGSFLLQVTLGCSADSCTFCGAYLDKPFRAKSEAEIFQDIEIATRHDPEIRRVFLMDGDALVLSQERLLSILEKLRTSFPQLARVGCYANGHQIVARTDKELSELADHGLKLFYIGLESGSQKVLDQCRKRATVEQMVEGVRRADSFGISSSVIVLLGLGGKVNSREHVQGTIHALNQMQPALLSFLTLMLVPGTELERQNQSGQFELLDSHAMLQEARDMLAGLELQKTVFRSNHASNYVSLEGRLPRDKIRLLEELDQVLKGKVRIRPEFLRGL